MSAYLFKAGMLIVWGIALSLVIVTFSGCAVTLPIGKNGRYGTLLGEVSYIPPYPDILKEQPNVGGLGK